MISPKVSVELSGVSPLYLIVLIKLRASRVPVHLSGEFMNFLHNLGSRVFTLKAKKRFGVEHGHEDTTTASYLFSTRNVEAWKSETNFGIQKDALRDALMMKLVSYYEDKYKLSDSQTTKTTTTTSTPAHRDVRTSVSLNNNKVDNGVWLEEAIRTSR
ncbi:hypothetical protein MSG28_001603 [Choristoneura fumiferana]|uniref:Uncharacterized protein n=1 Tax=Choristoneura fumiferana TaxID=7141 RepID=A0ACC0KUP1_CHOFU|nr:hypothetical protein MSG28_001603 [Choristoneura fumiferana]